MIEQSEAVHVGAEAGRPRVGFRALEGLASGAGVRCRAWVGSFIVIGTRVPSRGPSAYDILRPRDGQREQTIERYYGTRARSLLYLACVYEMR